MPAHAGGHCASARVPHAGAIMAMHAGGHALGHLGHLGHGFKLHGHACSWVIWVIVFCVTQMTQKAQIWRPGALGLWVIWVILSSNKNRRGMRRARSMHDLLGINPYIKIVNFVFCIS